MKLLTRCFVALFFMVFSLMLNANVEPTMSIRCQKDQSFSLHLKDIKKETYVIKLKDQLGGVLINEKIEGQEDYLKLFNLKNLPNGDYLLRIESEHKISLQTLHINKHKLSIKTGTQKEISKPSVKLKYPYIDLNMLHFEDSGVGMKLKDKKGDVLHEADFFLTGSITKRFQINALPIGTYTFEISTEHYSFKQDFSISVDKKRHTKALMTSK